jgi:hypothetical protein
MQKPTDSFWALGSLFFKLKDIPIYWEVKIIKEIIINSSNKNFLLNKVIILNNLSYQSL